MKGHCIFSHGFESGPNATKVTALAEVAERFGYSHERPDYTDLDGKLEVSPLGDIPARVARLHALASAAAARGPLILAGSSLGAFISGYVSMQLPVKALFLMAPPVTRSAEAYAVQPDTPPMPAADVPISIIHGWHDELFPAQKVVDWAAARNARLLLVNDAHRLTDHVKASADAFAALLAEI
jgi:predicted alpha/beta-hydrolase family hydrolase